MANEKAESTAHAITFLKATLDTPHVQVNPIAHWMIEDAVKSDEEMAKLLFGLLNVSTILLVRQEKLTGLTAEQILQDIARVYTDS
jgi:autonomous glycyl radical cofactor GrcA